MGSDDTTVSSQSRTTFATMVSQDGVAEHPPRKRVLPPRYTDLGSIGSGGMGEVRRVKDTVLDRILAMKIVRWDASRERFEAEARTTAKLQHPAIVAVHDYGELQDGRLWFTMPEVRGRTFREVLYSLHSASQFGTWGTTGDGWTFRRLLGAFETACQAVAYAHKGGVLHRDLKPDNIMVGAFGEVLVMDWGLAAIVTAQTTGTVQGTPAYMSPEQAWGRELTPAADVYSLGAVLYEILAGQPPFHGDSSTVVRQVKAGGPPELADIVGPAHPAIPPELSLLVDMAMAREPTDRPPDAAVFAAELRLWLEGARRREQGLRLVADADVHAPAARRARAKARVLRKNAARLLQELQPHDPVQDKAPAWADEDRAAQLEREAELAETRMEQALRAALNHDPELAEAHQRLADHYRGRLERAEGARRPTDVARYEQLLSDHDRGRHAAYLQGTGQLRITTDPPGVQVELFEFQREQRRLVPAPKGPLGRTPLTTDLPRGSYLLRLSGEGLETLDYPVLIERGGAWDGRGPDGKVVPIAMLPHGTLRPDEVAVPAGWFIAGGDPEAPDGLPRRRVWLDGFLIQRHPVTVQAYLDWVRGTDRRHWPRLDGEPLMLSDQGLATAVGILQPDHPICHVSWDDALAWCRDHGGRLPHDHEWEKAARGVDGRFFPWGDSFEPTWCNVHNSRAGAPWIRPVGSVPQDCSPYGVMDTAGNVRDWCLNGYSRDVEDIDLQPGDGPYRMCRGGAWNSSPAMSRLACRLVGKPDRRTVNYGFRMVRAWPTKAG